MKKRVLAFTLCLLMLFSTVPFSPVGLTWSASAKESSVDVGELKKVYDSIPDKSQWETLYLDTGDLEGWYKNAEEILASPEDYTQTNIDLTKTSLERAYGALKYHTESIALDKKSVTVNVGSTAQLKAILNPENAADEVKWTSSNTSAVTVSGTGLVTVKAYSKSDITITATSNQKSATCSVKTVNPLSGLKLSSTSRTIYDTEAFFLTVTPVGKDTASAVTNSVKYTWSTENGNVAKVTDGFVTGISKGTTKITVTATDGISTVKASCTVTVNELIAVTGLKAETQTVDGDFNLVVGETKTFKVTVNPEKASIKTLQWTSSDTSVAQIVATTISGNTVTASIKALKKGSSKITYKTTDGTNKSASFNAKVAPLVSMITLSETMRVISVDDKTAALRASVSPKDAGNQVLDWTTSDSSVCTVDRNGRLTPQKNGTCVITAKTTDGSNISVSCKIRVAPRATSVSLSINALGLKTGQTQALTATVKTVANSTYTGYVEWISDDTRVATVDEKGVIKAVYPGVAKIKAITLDGTEKTAVCTVSVVQPVEGVSLPATKTINIGKTATLTPTFKPSYATNQQVTWSSGNTSVATVDSKGVVTAKKVGTCTITCKTGDGGKTASCTVSVIIPTTSIKLSKTSATLKSGKTLTLTATVSPSDATLKDVTWKSSNTAVAKVSSTGVVTAVAGGVVTITATASGGQTATCSINVDQALESVSLNKKTATLYVTQTTTLKKTIVPSTATVKTYKWSTSDKSVATVDQNGVVTAVKAGTATITLKADDLKATCVVTVVKKVAATGIGISEKTRDLSIGQKFTLTATVKPADASNKGVTWSSSNTKIATVDANGVVKAVKEGTATITVKTKDGGYTAKCKVTVYPKVTGIRISETSINVNVGKSYSLSATVFPTDAINDEIIWSSSNTKVATVSSSGMVKGVSNGKATITAKTADGGFKATCTVNVCILVTKVTLNYETLKIEKGKSKQLIATVAPSNATNKKVTWTSSDTSIATVAESGMVLAKKTGKVTITAKGSNGKKATCTVNVIQYATGVSLNYSSVTLNAGKTKTLSATVKPSAATNKKVVWSTNNKNVVKVDEKGKLTAVNGGTAVVTCTSADGKAKTTCKVTVLQSISKIKLEPEKLSVKIGATKTIKATYTPKTATENKITWSSADKKIATVSSKGVVKGVSKGTVKITAKNPEGMVKAVCTVTVQKAATGVSLNKSTVTILKGKKTTITATVKPSDASIKTVTWSSNNYDVVDVDKNGTITAKSTGYAEVTAKTKDGGFKAVCRINVIQPAKGMTLATTAQTIDIGQTVTLKANFTPKDATNTAMKWTTSNKSVVTVDAYGKIKGIAKGKATITATTLEGGFVSKCTVTVVRKVKSVTLDKASLLLYLGSTATVKATVSPSNANDKSVTWTSSNTSVVTVSGGKLTPVKPGTANITVQTKDGGYKAVCKVTVEEPVKSVTLSKSSIDLVEGAVYTLKAMLIPSNATNKTVTWTSSDTKVATVKDGTVTAVSKGTVTITAKTSNGLTASCTVNVAKAVNYITISDTELSMNTFHTAVLSVKVVPEDASDKTITWTSSDEETATVTDGIVTAHKAGTVIITATSVNGLSQQCEVTITDIPVESLTLEEKEVSVNTFHTYELKAIVLPEDASYPEIIWESSDEEVVNVENGKLTANKAGTAVITATASNGMAEQCEVTVTDIDVELVTVTENLNMNVAATQEIKASVLPENATYPELTWESSNEEIATVENGIVTALCEGTVTITARTGNGVSAECTVVITTWVDSIGLSKETASLNRGETVIFEVTVLPENATDKTITWESSDEEVAVVENGVVTAVGDGIATVTAKAHNGVTVSCEVTVTTRAEDIYIAQTELALNKGETAVLEVTVLPENATDKTITWESSDEEVAVVENGVITAVGDGTAVITVKTHNGLTAECSVTVTTRVEKVIISESSVALNKGESALLEASVLPEDATDRTVTWESSDEKVAIVSNGVVTALGNGTAIITVKSVNDVTAQCEIIVTTKAESIGLSESFLVLTEGETVQLAATVLPGDATDKTVTWESSDEEIVTVENGLVKAVSEGTATLTVKTANGLSATCRIIVQKSSSVEVPPEEETDEPNE